MATHLLRSTSILVLLVVYGSLRCLAQAPPGLLHSEWILRSFDNADGSRDTIVMYNPTLRLDDEPSVYYPNTSLKRMGGYAGCNGWSGGYELFSPDSISMSFAGQNLLNCGKERNNLDNRYTAALRYMRRYELNGNYLRVHYHQSGSNNTGTMNFQRPYPVVRLVNLIEGDLQPGIDLQTDWDTVPRLTGLPSGWASGWLPLPYGPHGLRTQYGVDPNRVTLNTTGVGMYGDSVYTLFAMGGSILSVTHTVVVDHQRQASLDSLKVRVLVGSRNLPIERIWISNGAGEVVSDFNAPAYGVVTDLRSLPIIPYTLRFTLQGDPTEYSFTSGRVDTYRANATLILQYDNKHGIRVLRLDQHKGLPQPYLGQIDTLQRSRGGAGALRIATLHANNYNSLTGLNIDGHAVDTPGFRCATRLYHYRAGLISIRESYTLSSPYTYLVEVAPDSITTVISSDGPHDILRTPIDADVPDGESRLRFLYAGASLPDSFNLHVRYANGNTEVITGIVRSTPVYATVPAGKVVMTVYKSGSAVPVMKGYGTLPSSAHVTAIVSAYSEHDSTFGINLLNESDSSAQTPMVMLQRLPNDTARGRFRTVNVMQGRAELCAHFSGSDSLCLPYRTASHHYEDEAGMRAEKLEVEWEGGDRGNIQPKPLRPDTLTTLFSLGRAGTHFTIAKFLETPLRQSIPAGRSMLRILNAAFGSGIDSARINYGGTLRTQHLLFDEVSDYGSVPSGPATVSLYKGDGSELLKVRGNIPEGRYATLILTGSDDSLGVDLLIDSDSTDQMPLVHFSPAASVASTTGTTGGLRLLPNPAGESVRLTFSLQREERIAIDIYDSRGTLVRRQEAMGAPGVQNITISTSQLPAGMYEVIVRNGEGEMYGRGRVVVVR